MTDADVVIVGAGPTGLMLAGELAGLGVRTLVLERRSEPSQVARAGGLAGHILQLLHYRGELELFQAARSAPEPTPVFPFGGVHLDFTRFEESPMRALPIPQPRLEEVLAVRAVARGATVLRGHAFEDVAQDASSVTLQVRGAEGQRRISSAFVVGCDGGRSRVRSAAGIAFEGTSLPEVERLASFTIPDGITVRDDGSVEVDGVGTLPFGYTATEHGVFAISGFGGNLGVYTAETEATAYGDDDPFTVEELQASVRRVLGIDLPLGAPLRMTRFGYSAKQADTYRAGRVLLAGDAAHLFPAGGVAVNAGMLDAANLAWKLAATLGGASDDLLDSYVDERRRAAERTLLHTRAQVALRRAHGSTGDALRALVVELASDEPALTRLGALMAGTDVGGAPDGVVGTFATGPAVGLPSDDPRLRGLLAHWRPVLLDRAGRTAVREAAVAHGGIDVVELSDGEPPFDAALLRPDSMIAFVALRGESDAVAVPRFHEAAARWFPTGSPV